MGCQNSAAPLPSGSTSSRPRPSRVFELRGDSHPLHQPQYALLESRECPLWGRQPPGEFLGQQRDRVFAPHRSRARCLPAGRCRAVAKSLDKKGTAVKEDYQTDAAMSERSRRRSARREQRRPERASSGGFLRNPPSVTFSGLHP